MTLTQEIRVFLRDWDCIFRLFGQTIVGYCRKDPARFRRVSQSLARRFGLTELVSEELLCLYLEEWESNQLDAAALAE